MFHSYSPFKSFTTDSLKSLSPLQRVALVCLLMLPVFHLTFNDWTGVWMVWGSVFSLLALTQSKGAYKIVWQDKQTYWMILALVAYPLVTFVSQLCRLSFSHKAYLDISPFVYFIPVFLFVIWSKVDMGKFLQIILPITILGALWSCYYHHRELAKVWSPDVTRLTPYFSDPLAFGQMMLTLGLMCLSSIDLKKWGLQQVLLKFWLLIGFFTGMYLSVESGSRTGWLAIPIIFFLIIVLKLDWSFKISIPLAMTISVIIFILFYLLVPFAHIRIDKAIAEITHYPWNTSVNWDNSVGLRITLQRLGWFYFSQSPICGWGNMGYGAIKDAPEILPYTTQWIRDFAFGALFHNELMTQMVRYGILGILGYLAAVGIPLTIAFKNIRSSKEEVSRSALLCAVFIICQIVAGLTDEFLNLKGMVAFYGFIISMLIGTIIPFLQKKSLIK